ncbi:MAG: hypothetical protein JO320_18520 [Alphaproteobacteria bacterium]|nr:hypothetical protein [Alphaproteobacteria bacterium]MBV9377018.1 hypothetical protein [Alphaproteobacteria bacterium]
MVRRNRVLAAGSLGVLGLLALGGCANPSAPGGSPAQTPPLGAGMARIWVLRQTDPEQGNFEAARPTVFANGAPLGESQEGTAFFHDLPPGTYKLTVQAFGTPAKQSDTVQLSAGMQSYVQIQAVPNWEEGSRVGGWSFAVLSMSPEVAQQYLPTMTFLGQR